MRALRDTLAQDKELLIQNTSIGLVGLDTPFKLYDNEDVGEWLEKLGDVGSSRGRRQAEEAEAEAAAAAETSAPADEDIPVPDVPAEPIETDD